MPIRALVFDADDTLWAFSEIVGEALEVALAAGRTARPDLAAMFDRLDPAGLQALRDQLAADAEATGRVETLAEVRRRSFHVALTATSGPDTPAPALDRLGDLMADAYMAHRHDEVRLFPEVAGVLAEVGERYVLGLVTNGNTDPARSGLGDRFAFRLAAEATGISKPDPRAFFMAAAAAGCHPNEVVSVGDQLGNDIVAAQSVGCRAVWVNRTAAPCPPGIEPDGIIADLGELAAVLARFDAEDEDALRRVGVGPHPEPWPADDRYDPELLEGGDRRNVVDRYRYWREDAIIADLDAHRHPFHVAIENWRHDRNIGTVVRNANAFNAAGVHIVGRRRWNRRGAMATDRYLSVHQHDTIQAFVAWARESGLAIVAIDNVAGAVPLEGAALPERCVLVFGQEGPGVSPAVLDVADLVCAITQYGSTRSINAGVASGIAFHAWIRTHVSDLS